MLISRLSELELSSRTHPISDKSISAKPELALKRRDPELLFLPVCVPRVRCVSVKAKVPEEDQLELMSCHVFCLR